ncbi:MAG: tyrosine-type recombinase/integrase [Dehalococcoidia bacterium]|nr:MAG: tyrosine-type recombinase/integrase [Dehalococcoidia bacterium]
MDYLIEQADCARDKAIISLFADSGLRLSELVSIKVSDIDRDNRSMIFQDSLKFYKGSALLT